MKSRPVYRSLTFWSGILTMAFMLWAWADSLTANSHASRYPHVIGSREGMIFLRRSTFPMTPAVGRGPGGSSHPFETGLALPPLFLRGGGEPYTIGPIDQSSMEKLRHGMRISPKSDWILAIPHWLLLATVATAWITALLTRDRRQVQIRAGMPMTAAPECPPP